MEEQSAPVEREEPAPVFAVYRRGYDPDQVDQYVAEQSVRIEAANQRADGAEEKLATAVAQMREMHKRITALESRDPVPAPPAESIETIPVDTLGIHVQRILSDAWEGSTALREEAEHDAADVREKALAEGDRIVASARRKAESIGEEMARRRQAYLERLDAERAKAVSQMTFLQDQREIAIADLTRLRTLVDSTIAEVTVPSRTATPPAPEPEDEIPSSPAAATSPESPASAVRIARPVIRVESVLVPTLPVHHVVDDDPEALPDASELVRSHRARRRDGAATGVIRTLPARPDTPPRRPSFFDFDAEETD